MPEAPERFAAGGLARFFVLAGEKALRGLMAAGTIVDDVLARPQGPLWVSAAHSALRELKTLGRMSDIKSFKNVPKFSCFQVRPWREYHWS